MLSGVVRLSLENFSTCQNPANPSGLWVGPQVVEVHYGRKRIDESFTLRNRLGRPQCKVIDQIVSAESNWLDSGRSKVACRDHANLSEAPDLTLGINTKTVQAGSNDRTSTN